MRAVSASPGTAVAVGSVWIEISSGTRWSGVAAPAEHWWWGMYELLPSSMNSGAGSHTGCDGLAAWWWLWRVWTSWLMPRGRRSWRRSQDRCCRVRVIFDLVVKRHQTMEGGSDGPVVPSGSICGQQVSLEGIAAVQAVVARTGSNRLCTRWKSARVEDTPQHAQAAIIAVPKPYLRAAAVVRNALPWAR